MICARADIMLHVATAGTKGKLISSDINAPYSLYQTVIMKPVYTF
jgi:hypothetical protein